MTLEGTLRNGIIVPDHAPQLPEGTRVRYEAVVDDGDIGPPPAAETRAEFIASLRESIVETRAGVPGIPLDVAMARIAAECGWPWPAPE